MPNGTRRGNRMITLSLLDTGYCKHPEAVVLSGASLKPAKFPSTVAVLEHRKHGVILFDTGYSERFFSATDPFPERLYRWLTPVSHQDSQSAVAQLKRRGISASDVRTIIVSHFHADHVGGLRDFPNATFLYNEHAYQALRHKSRWGRLLAGFLADLIPDDFTQRSQVLTPNTLRQGILPYAPFCDGYDLLGDGSLIAIELPGHAPGQIGLWVQTVSGPVFLVADACWRNQAYTEGRLPHRLTGLLHDSWSAYQSTVANLHMLHTRHPEIPIVACHCDDVLPEARICSAA